MKKKSELKIHSKEISVTKPRTHFYINQRVCSRRPYKVHLKWHDHFIIIYTHTPSYVLSRIKKKKTFYTRQIHFRAIWINLLCKTHHNPTAQPQPLAYLHMSSLQDISRSSHWWRCDSGVRHASEKKKKKT